MNAQPPRIAARNARNRQRDRAPPRRPHREPNPTLEAVMHGTATLAIHCWPAESGTQARVYARVPADAARTITDEHPLTRDESLLWPLWTGTVCGAPVTITTP
jgi:hypothetical protein